MNDVLMNYTMPILAAKMTQDIAGIIQQVLSIFQYAGIVLLVYGIFTMIMALKNEDADSKITSATQIGIAIFCITSKVLMSEFFTLFNIH